jgi:transcriptional regulator with XRE-family HTH domain
VYRLRVREVLQEKGRTQTWLARKSGVQVTLIRRMLREPETYTPAYPTLAAIAKALKVSMDELIEEIPDEDD